MTKTTKIKLGVYIFVVFFCLFYSGFQAVFIPIIAKQDELISMSPLTFVPKELPIRLPNTVPPPITAASYLVIDADSFTPLLALNSTSHIYPASLIKLATALIAYKHYGLNDSLLVKTVIDEEVKMGLVPSERITALSLLYGTLISSANDAAYTIAENYPGGVSMFVKEMNSLASTLNMKSTKFINPIGFDDERQRSTAYDLALLSKEFIRYPFLMQIASTKSITVTDTTSQYYHYLLNGNQLIGVIPHLGGLKTGTTDLAGENLISYYLYNSHPLIFIVLKSEDRFTDTKQLISYITSTVSYRDLESL